MYYDELQWNDKKMKKCWKKQRSIFIEILNKMSCMTRNDMGKIRLKDKAF